MPTAFQTPAADPPTPVSADALCKIISAEIQEVTKSLQNRLGKLEDMLEATSNPARIQTAASSPKCKQQDLLSATRKWLLHLLLHHRDTYQRRSKQKGGLKQIKKAKHHTKHTKKHTVSSSSVDNEDSDASDNASPTLIEQLLHATGLSLKKKQSGDQLSKHQDHKSHAKQATHCPPTAGQVNAALTRGNEQGGPRGN